MNQIKFVEINQRLKEIQNQTQQINHMNETQETQLQNWNLDIDSPASKEKARQRLIKLEQRVLLIKQLAEQVLKGEAEARPRDFYYIHQPHGFFYVEHWDETLLQGQAGKNWIKDYLRYWEIILDRENYFLNHIHPDTTFYHVETGEELNKIDERLKRNRQRVFNTSEYRGY